MTDRKPTEQRRREIADAAIKIIGERGLREFTAAQIAREVGIADGTIFRHFTDKREIVLAAVGRLSEILQPGVEPSGGDPLERLRRFFLDRVRMVATQPGVQSLLFSDQLAHAAGPAASERLVGLRRRGRAYVRDCLAEAQAAGQLREGIDVEAVAVMIHGAVLTFVFYEKDRVGTESLDEAAARVWRTLVELVRRP